MSACFEPARVYVIPLTSKQITARITLMSHIGSFLYNATTNNSATQLDKALLVFARHLVDEMRYINYPKEWSRPPLNELLPHFYDILNYHPDKLGDFVLTAYERTFPDVQRGNVNQLGAKMAEPTKDYDLFGKTRHYS